MSTRNANDVNPSTAIMCGVWLTQNNVLIA